VSESPSVPPAKPPRTYESDIDQIENVEPVVTEVTRAGPSTTKRQAPLPPTSLSPPHTSTPGGTVPSPVKMMRVDEDAEDSAEDKNELVVETAPQEDDQAVDIQSSQVRGENDHSSKLVSNPAKKTTATGHVSSATLIFGGSASATSCGTVAKSTPTKVAVIKKPSLSGSQQASAVKGTSDSSADDSMVDEPTKQPVAVRLVAWQTKQVPPTTKEPVAVSSRVKNYERKITAGSASEKTKTPLKLRPQAEPLSNKSTIVTSIKMSPVKARGVAMSPVKPVSSSPQKLSPATRAIQERLTQICEAGTRNEAVDRERMERAAELANVENRWQCSSDNSASSVSSVKCVDIELSSNNKVIQMFNILLFQMGEADKGQLMTTIDVSG